MHFMMIRVKGAPMGRIYVEKSCLSQVLEDWLNKNCFDDAHCSEGLHFKSWAFETKKGDILHEVMRSHGAEHETNKHASWLKG